MFHLEVQRPADELLGRLPEEVEGVHGELLGSGHAGRLELFGIASPDGAPPRVAPTGLLALSFAVGDLEPRIATCRRHGFEATDPERVMTGAGEVSSSFVSIGGLLFELVRFET